MHPTTGSFIPAEFLRLLYKYRRRFLTVAGAIAVCVTLFALARPRTWEASQALIVRNEAVVRAVQERPGRFDRPEQMQTVQETILELARSRSVLAATLAEVGDETGEWPAGFPSDLDIDELRDNVRMTPPKGAEFGKTEVFYLNVKDHDRQRAVRLASILCRNLQSHYQRVRDRKAQSMIDELARTAAMARKELKAVTARLEQVETQVGVDLSELRILEKSPSGNSDLRTQLNTLEIELRDAHTAQRSNEELRKLLEASTQDAGHLLAAPNRLLESQPAIRRLKDGLIDAQLHTSRLRGNMSEEHPSVQAGVAAETEVRRNLSGELAIALRGVEIDLRLTQVRVETLTSQLSALHARLDKLATVRADYGNLIEEITQRQQILKTAEENLADARGTQAAARSASLIGLIDTPDTGSKPVGPGRTMIVLCGVFGGIAVGLGVVLLSVPPAMHVSGSPQSPGESGHAAAGGLSLKEALARLAHRRTSWN